VSVVYHVRAGVPGTDNKDGVHMPRYATETDQAIAEIRQDQAENGFTFPLRVTYAGRWKTEDDIPLARVRRIATLDAATLQVLPQNIQDQVWLGIKEMRKAQEELQGTDPDTLNKMLANNDKILRAATIWCQASFISPILVDDPSQIKPGCWLTTRVAAEDRIGVFLLSMDGDSPLLGRLQQFRPEWASDEADDAALQASPSPIRSLESVQPGV
jgi:hypothetical protein